MTTSTDRTVPADQSTTPTDTAPTTAVPRRAAGSRRVIAASVLALVAAGGLAGGFALAGHGNENHALPAATHASSSRDVVPSRPQPAATVPAGGTVAPVTRVPVAPVAPVAPHVVPRPPEPPAPPKPPQPSAAIETLQRELGQLNYYEGPVTGVMNAQTTAAITYLQRDAHLPQTGTMDAATAQALQSFLAHGNNQMAG